MNLDEDLGAAFDEMQAEENDAGRDELGRFKAKEPEEPAQPEETPDTPVEPAQTAETPEEITVPEPAVEAVKPIDPPPSWAAEEKERFASLPPDVQGYLVKRESDREAFLTQKSQEASEFKRQYEPLNQVLTPRRQAWAMQGMTEPQAISQLLAISDHAASKPEEFIKWFASQRGIDLGNLQGTATAPDPLQPVMQQVQSLQQRLDQQQQAETARVIDSFATTHEHFNDVRAYMGSLMQGGLARDMEDAYSQACRANPAVWGKMQQAEQAKAEEARKAQDARRISEASAAAAKAKKSAGTQLSTTASLNGGVAPPANWEDSLSRAYDSMHS